MTRRLAPVALLAALVVAAGGDARSVAAPAFASPRIQLVVPGPGHVAVQAVRIRVAGAGRGLVVPPQLVQLASPRPGVTALVSARKARGAAADTYTLVAIVVNRKGGARAPAAAAAQAPGQPVEFREEIPWHLYAQAKDIPDPWGKGRTIELVPDATAFVQIEAERQVDTLTAPQRADFVAGLKALLDAAPAWDPLQQPALLGAPTVDTGHYDDGHAFGWTKRKDTTPASAWRLLNRLLATAAPKPPAETLDQLIARVTAIPAQLPEESDNAPSIAVKATFVPARRTTRYQVADLQGNVVLVGRSDIVWSLTPPVADPGCNNRRSTWGIEQVLRWYHGDDVCDHAKEGQNGHQGVVGLTVTFDEHWLCTAAYAGSNTGLGPRGTCRAGG